MDNSNHTSIMFVDDESRILAGIRRMLYPMRNKWQMAFANSGAEALEVMSQDSFDIIVSDMHMPKMSGFDLLKLVKEQHPNTIRIILSGRPSPKLKPESLSVVHQYLRKPCEAEKLIATVNRSTNLRNILRNNAIRELVLQMQSLPSDHAVLMQLRNELNSPEPSIQRAGEIISRDMGLTMKVLQLANSGLITSPSLVFDPKLAVKLLGIETLLEMVESIDTVVEIDPTKVARCSLENLWEHSNKVRDIVEAITKVEDFDRREAAEASQAGFLHDIGKIILADKLSDAYLSMLSLVSERKTTPLEAEKQIFGCTHPEVGAYLLGLWDVEESVVTTTRYHHEPIQGLENQHLKVMAAVHVANAFELAFENREWGKREDYLDVHFLSESGFEKRLPLWGQVSEPVITQR